MKYILLLLLVYITSYAQQPCPGIPTIVYGGQTYNTVAIGDHCWLKENLNVGTRIIGSSDQTNNSIIEKYCYNDDTANCTIYGGLYQWAEVVQYKNGATNTTSPNPAFIGNIQGICPAGWHLPTYSELQTLGIAVSNDGNALKAVGQGAGTNTSGFSALLAAYRYAGGYYHDLGGSTYFWSSTESSETLANSMNLFQNDISIYINGNYKEDGSSVRCLNNNIVGINDNNNKSELPKEFSLSQNFPNPFNPTTVISYSLPYNSLVKLNVYNALGMNICQLFNGVQEAGNHKLNFNVISLPSGVYFYSISTSSFDGKQNFTSTKKMIIMK